MLKTQSKLAAALVLILGAAPAHASENVAMQADPRLSLDGVQLGWAMSDYGVEGAAIRAASLRAVLADHAADDVPAQAGLFSAVSYFMLTLFAGGGGAPLDVANPRHDLDEYFSSGPVQP